MVSGSGWSRALGRSRESWASRTSRSEKIMPSEGIGSWCFAPSHFAGGHTPTPSRRGTRGHSRTLSHRTSRTYPRRRRGGKEPDDDDEKEQEIPPSWPVALRGVRGWLDPWVMLWRYWRAWSKAPPPPQLRALLDAVGKGHSRSMYTSLFNKLPTIACCDEVRR